jgi:hypothetical protein
MIKSKARFVVSTWTILAVVAASCLAMAGEPSPSPACKGPFSLSSPLPDACLGVIDTDRPHQTDTPHVVPTGHSQFESALGQVQLGGKLGASADNKSARVLLFENAYKFGIASHTDLQLIVKHAEYVPQDRKFSSPGPLLVRAKFNVVDEHGWVPTVTLVPTVFLPFDQSQALRVGPLAFWGWQLPLHIELEMNAGVLMSTKPKPPFALVLASALTFTVIGNLHVFVDGYATGKDVAFGTGALWAFTRDMQVDLGTYVGLNGDEPVATPFVGFSMRR